jgi:integrase
MPKDRGSRRPGLTLVRRPGRAAFYLRGTVRGIGIFESTGTDDAGLAEEARAAREAELYRGAILGFQAKVTFAEAATSYMQTEQRGPMTLLLVGKLVRHFGPKVTCDGIRQQQLDEAARAICKATSTPATIRRHVTTPLSAVMNHAARRGWCGTPKFERTKPSGRRTDWFTPAEAEALITAAAPHLRPLLAFLFCTGARLGEALALMWERVDLAHGRAVLTTTKNGDDRILTLCPRAIAALAALPAGANGARTGAVFRHPGRPRMPARPGEAEGTAYRTRGRDDAGGYGSQIKRAWAGALRRAGIARHLTPHHARHSWASWHYAVHRDPLALRDAGGWRALAMVERYAKLAPRGMVSEILAFWGTALISGETERKIA